MFNAGYGKYDVFTALADGSDRQVLMHEARQPDFGPDGRVLFNGDGGGRDNVFSVKVDGSDLLEVSRYPADAHPNWSPEGTRFAIDSLFGPDSGQPFVYVQDNLTGQPEPRSLASQSTRIRGRVSTWLSDGRIVFTGCDYWDPASRGSRCGLYAVWDGGGNPVQLTASPDDTAADGHGSRIVFMSLRDGDWEVYIMAEDGTEQRNLSNSPSGDGLPTWSPDGEWIGFLSDRSGVWAVWAMRPDGSQARELFPIGGPMGGGEYDWTTESISWGP